MTFAQSVIKEYSSINDWNLQSRKTSRLGKHSSHVKSFIS